MLGCKIVAPLWLPVFCQFRKNTRSFKLGKCDSLCPVLTVERDDDLIVVQEYAVYKGFNKSSAVFKVVGIKGAEMIEITADLVACQLRLGNLVLY